MTNTFTPCLFRAIAEEVATGLAEQYLTAFREGGVTVMFSTPAVEMAISKSGAQFKSGTDIIAFECQASDFVSADAIFTDNFQSVMDCKGILVEVSVRKLRDGVHRVLFSRVDAGRMYRDHAARLEKIESAVRDLQAAGKTTNAA